MEIMIVKTIQMNMLVQACLLIVQRMKSSVIQLESVFTKVGGVMVKSTVIMALMKRNVVSTVKFQLSGVYNAINS